MALAQSLTLLRSRFSFRRLLTARITSLVGDGVHTTTNIWLAAKLSDSTLALGSVAVAYTIPLIVFSLIGGVSVDRYNRKAILIASDLVRAVGVGLLALMTFAGQVQIWQIALFAMLSGAASAFFSPCVSAVIPATVDREELQPANALASMAGRIGMIVGTALGGTIIAQAGASTGYLVDAVSFVVSAVLVAGMAVPAPVRLGSGQPRPGFRGAWGDLKAGIAYIAGQRDLLALVVLTMAMNVANIPVYTFAPQYAESVLGLGDDPQRMGLLWPAMMAGMFVGPLLLSAVFKVGDKVLVILLATAAFAAGEVLLGLAPPYAPALLTLGLMGAGLSVEIVLTNTLYQARVPAAMLGRFFANVGLLTLGLQPLVISTAGVAADRIGVAPALAALGGGLLAACALWSPLYPRVKRSIVRVEMS